MFCSDSHPTILEFDKMVELSITTEGGELKRARITDPRHKIDYLYSVEDDCNCCHRWRTISGVTGCCFECDNPALVRDMKILLGLDHD